MFSSHSTRPIPDTYRPFGTVLGAAPVQRTNTPSKAHAKKKHKAPPIDTRQYARDFIFNKWGAKALAMSGL